jgi:protein-tyrosine phosphatase
MTDATGVPPVSRQLAGPVARPKGHPNHAFVVPLLGVGEYPTVEDAGWLGDAVNVRAVVSLQDDVDLYRKGLRAANLAQALATQGIAWHRHPIGDGDLTAMDGAIDAVVHCIHQHIGGGERVYLHCNAGFNRAPTVAIAYLCMHGDLSLDAACAVVKSVRPCVPYMQLLRTRYR